MGPKINQSDSSASDMSKEYKVHPNAWEQVREKIKKPQGQMSRQVGFAQKDDRGLFNRVHLTKMTDEEETNITVKIGEYCLRIPIEARRNSISAIAQVPDVVLEYVGSPWKGNVFNRPRSIVLDGYLGQAGLSVEKFEEMSRNSPFHHAFFDLTEPKDPNTFWMNESLLKAYNLTLKDLPFKSIKHFRDNNPTNSNLLMLFNYMLSEQPQNYMFQTPLKGRFGMVMATFRVQRFDCKDGRHFGYYSTTKFEPIPNKVPDLLPPIIMSLPGDNLE